MQDAVVPDINKRFSKRIAGMDNRIASSTEHTRLFLPLTCFCKPDQQTTTPEHIQGHSTTNAENFDDALLDRETQEKILEDIRCRRLSCQSQQNINQQQMEGPLQTQDEMHSKELHDSNHQAACQAQQQSQNINSGQYIVGSSNSVVGASIDRTGN